MLLLARSFSAGVLLRTRPADVAYSATGVRSVIITKKRLFLRATGRSQPKHTPNNFRTPSIRSPVGQGFLPPRPVRAFGFFFFICGRLPVHGAGGFVFNQLSPAKLSGSHKDKALVPRSGRREASSNIGERGGEQVGPDARADAREHLKHRRRGAAEGAVRPTHAADYSRRRLRAV